MMALMTYVAYAMKFRLLATTKRTLNLAILLILLSRESVRVGERVR